MRSRIKSVIFNKKTLIYILAFLIPIIIMAGYVFYVDVTTNHSFFNNGENFLLADMASQYNSLYNYIRDVLVGNESVFYSFSKGLGGNMASTVGYYLSSPFNILYIFVSKVDIPLMTYIILLIKIGLCSLFMNMFLNYKYKPRYTNLIFSISYALMGFTTVYYFNNMWLDVIYMTPLVMIGINKLIDGNILYYVITLALAIMFNFYIAYMLCIFCVIYFLYELFCKYRFKEFKNYRKIVFSFALSSLLAAGISCFMLIPCLSNLSYVMRFELDKEQLAYNYLNLNNSFFNELWSKTFFGTHNVTSVLGRNRSVIYVCLFNIVLGFLFFFNKKIRRKEKILSLLVILFMLLSLIVPQLKLFWQAFSFPNGYINRFSFLYVFFIIYIASKCFYNLDKIKIRYFLIFLVLYILAAMKTQKIYLVFLDSSDIFISEVLVVIYTILYFIYTRFNIRKIISSIILLIVIEEVSFNYIDTLITIKNMKIVNSYKTYYTETCHNINNIERSFYRIDGDYYYSYLDSHVCGFKGVTTALSTNDGNLYRFFHKNGGSLTYTTLVYDINKLPIFDALFGIKYVISKDKFEDTLYNDYSKFSVTKYNSFKKVYEIKDRYIYKNPYALSLGYIINNNYKNYDKKSYKDSLESLNALFKSISGINKNVLIPLKKEYLGDNTYKFDIDTDSDYLYLTVDYDIAVNWSVYDTVYINDEYIASLDSENIGAVKIKNNYKNSNIIMRLDNYQYTSKDKAYLYYFDVDAFKLAINNLKSEQMKNIKIKGNKVSGDIKISKDSTMMLSIPYEQGWRVYVDGRKVNYKKIAGDFIGLDLKKGRHHIKMVYYPNKFFSGIFISFCSIGILLLYIIKDNKKNIISSK